MNFLLKQLLEWILTPVGVSSSDKLISRCASRWLAILFTISLQVEVALENDDLPGRFFCRRWCPIWRGSCFILIEVNGCLKLRTSQSIVGLIEPKTRACTTTGVLCHEILERDQRFVDLEAAWFELVTGNRSHSLVREHLMAECSFTLNLIWWDRRSRRGRSSRYLEAI